MKKNTDNLVIQHGNILTEVDSNTGEVKSKYGIYKIRDKAITGGFFMAIQEGFEYLSKLDLTGEQFKVLTYIMSQLDFENYILMQQKDVAAALGMKKENVSRSFSKLIKEGIIHEGPRVGKAKTYRLDIAFGYKGRGKNYVKELGKLKVFKGGKADKN